MSKLTIVFIALLSLSSIAHDMPNEVKVEKALEAILKTKELSEYKVMEGEKVEVSFPYLNLSSYISRMKGADLIGIDRDYDTLTVLMTKGENEYMLECDSGLKSTEEVDNLNDIDTTEYLYKYSVDFFGCLLENLETGKSQDVYIDEVKWTRKEKY